MSTAKKVLEKAGILFHKGRFCVTESDITTPTSYYPVAATVGKIRRDILYTALIYYVLSHAALFIYFGLWTYDEMIFLIFSPAIFASFGAKFSLLEINAKGFPSRLYFARSKTVRGVFDAIVKARSLAAEKDNAAVIEDADAPE